MKGGSIAGNGGHKDSGKIVTRRDFLVVSGAIIALGALTGCSSKKITQIITSANTSAASTTTTLNTSTTVPTTPVTNSTTTSATTTTTPSQMVTTTTAPIPSSSTSLPTTTTPPTTTTTTPSPTAFFNFKSVLFNQTTTLSVSVPVKTGGTVTISGVDTQQPTTPFSWDWGDGQVTQGFFPASHTFSDLSQNYIVMVTAHYKDGSTASVQTIIRFAAPSVKAVSLPPDIGVTIPASALTLASRMAAYTPSSNLTAFDDSYFQTMPRSTVEYILSVVALIQKNLANNDVFLVNGTFNQVVLRDPAVSGMYSMWYTNPVSFGAGNYAFQGTFQWSSFMHEMGHNVSLNSPASYYYGGKIDGNANAIFSETMAQIFQHATAYTLVNDYQTYGLSQDIVFDIEQSALTAMGIVRTSYQNYLSGEKTFASWNDPSTTVDETFNTFMTLAYKFCEHAENGQNGYKTPLKKMMKLLQLFDANMASQYDQANNTDTAATYRSTLMITALSYAFDTDLRSEFKTLNFPVSDSVYNDLYQKATSITSK
jgi:hypothetical protein